MASIIANGVIHFSYKKKARIWFACQMLFVPCLCDSQLPYLVECYINMLCPSMINLMLYQVNDTLSITMQLKDRKSVG